jgi:hypothetical protein
MAPFDDHFDERSRSTVPTLPRRLMQAPPVRQPQQYLLYMLAAVLMLAPAHPHGFDLVAGERGG